MYSVVIPLYNKELSIKNTIQSVLDQSYQDFEVLVVNDGSTDNSAKIVETISDNRIRLISQRNQGVSAARNRGVKEAKYKWIALLDGDDLWESNHLEEVVKMMRLFPGEKVYVTSLVFSDGRCMYRHKRKLPIFKIENYFKEVIKESLVSSSNVVIYKDCFDFIGGFNVKLSRGEDLDLWSRLAKEYTIVKSVELTAIYKVDAENRTFITKDIEKTHVYYFKFNEAKDYYEKEYYKHVILNRLYNYIRLGYFFSFVKLKTMFPEVKLIDLFLFVMKKVKGRLIK